MPPEAEVPPLLVAPPVPVWPLEVLLHPQARMRTPAVKRPKERYLVFEALYMIHRSGSADRTLQERGSTGETAPTSSIGFVCLFPRHPILRCSECSL